MRLALLGFGLIGGSIARAARSSGQVDSIAAWSPTGRGPEQALADGVLDVAAASPAAALAQADLVVLAAPPLACLDLLAELAGPLRAALPADATVTDVASTKGAIVAHADALGLPFVGGHPMAGRETVGYESGTAGLFADRPWVVVPGALAREEDVRRVEALAVACRARPITLSAAEHDAATAAISHLPLLVSAALVEAVAGSADGALAGWPLAARLAASGWRDATRLAIGDAAMGAGILATNAAAVSGRLARLRAVLDSWQSELDRPDGPDARRMQARLEGARGRLAARTAGDTGPSDRARRSP